MSVGICVLAYGPEFWEKTNHLIESIVFKNLDIQFYIISDNPRAITKHPKVIVYGTHEPFNYNLKRMPLSIALRNHKYVFLMDADVYLKNNIDLSKLETIETGVYVNWMNVVNDDVKLSSEIEYEYISKLNSLNKTQTALSFIDESIILFNLSGLDSVFGFMDSWNNLYNQTINIQPEYRNKGAVEGLMIYLSCLNNNIPIKQIDGNNIVKNFVHYRGLKLSEIKNNKQLI